MVDIRVQDERRMAGGDTLSGIGRVGAHMVDIRVQERCAVDDAVIILNKGLKSRVESDFL
jgi:hypothetical protein